MGKVTENSSTEDKKVHQMKKSAALLAIILFAVAAWGQDTSDMHVTPYYTPDYQQIQKDCKDKHSSRYYPKLVKRFAQLDTTLNIIDLHTFYYGQAYLDSYMPYDNPKEFDQIRDILNKEETPTLQETRTIVKLADAVIARQPAEPRAYYYKYIAQNIACQNYEGDTIEMMISEAQFEALFNTILSTGNGISPELAMHVVSVSHEYMMMGMFGFQSHMQALIRSNGHSYDLFALDSNEYGVDTLYFNIDRIIESWSKLFPEEKETKNGGVTSIDLELGTKFVLEMKKAKRKNSKFVLVKQEPIYDTLIVNDSLFSKTIPENQIVGYFCPMRLTEKSESVYNCLVFRSNSTESWLQYDTYISRDGVRFSTTSNNGMPRNVLMNEMWHDDAQYLRISNIRKRK